MTQNPKSKTQNPKSIRVLGAGPAGLYFALLAKKADPSCAITVIERNPADVTYGWGVVFSDRTLASFQRADYKTYERITENFVIWDAIDVRYRGETVRCGGHVIASISRKLLLNILQERCAELGVNMVFGREIHDLAELDGSYDLLVAADGINSLARRQYEGEFKPRTEMGRARYIWLGGDKVLDAFTFIFHETEHGLFQVHAYPYSGTSSTFIVECAQDTWQRAGLDRATEEESLAFCQRLLNDDLHGAYLLSNNSRWISFTTLKTKHWHTTIQNLKSKIQNIVLLGDAAHTAHFSIGSGTKLAMEDAIALANALEQHPDIRKALDEYELERKPVVETFQRAAHESQIYFETLKRYLVLDPVPFAFQLLTRSGRITYDDLHFRDARFGDMVDRWMHGRGEAGVAPPPMFAPLQLGTTCLRNRVVMSPIPGGDRAGTPGDGYIARLVECAEGGAGLMLAGTCAVSPEGRVTPADVGMYSELQGRAWSEAVEKVHASQGARIGVRLGHAGRRGSTRPRSEGLDRPLKEGNWPLISASPSPYTPTGQVPREMDRADMDRVRDDFVMSARIAHEASFDLLQLDFAHGYLLASFLSPLTNRREDEYGGSPENRARYPLEVLGAVRSVWVDRPLSVVVTATDYVKGGLEVEDAIELARMLKAGGCDLVQVHAGQTTPEAEPPYARGFLTPLADRIRNEAGVPTLVGGYLTTSNEANTVLAAGKADLCLMEI
ncbi:MAG TPA: FAD-dependent monooxygenase [Chloroflexia bacterium]